MGRNATLSVGKLLITIAHLGLLFMFDVCVWPDTCSDSMSICCLLLKNCPKVHDLKLLSYITPTSVLVHRIPPYCDWFHNLNIMLCLPIVCHWFNNYSTTYGIPAVKPVHHSSSLLPQLQITAWHS